MTNDEDGDEGFGDDPSAEVEAGKIKGRTGTGRRIARNLQRARKLYEGSGFEPSKEADFRVQEAMILALLDLTEAIREQNVSASR